MSVLIKGMDMPKSCKECPFKEYANMSYELDWCCINKADISYEMDISPNCPLVEVPTPHGDLIDSDYLIEHSTEVYGLNNTRIFYLDEAMACPIIIEAEG